MNRQLFEYHPTIGYRFVPDLKARIRHENGGYLVKTNKLGFRSDVEFVSERSQGNKKILLYGDSFTAGDGVSNGQRFSDILDRAMPNVDIYNFGLPGIGPDQKYLIHKEYASGMQYDMVVIVILVENIRRINKQYRVYREQHLDYFKEETGGEVIYEKPLFQIDELGSLNLTNTPLNRFPIDLSDTSLKDKSNVDSGGRFQAVRKLLRQTGLKNLVKKYVKYQPVPEYNSANTPEWMLMSALLKEWVGHINAPVLLVPLPMHQFTEEVSDPSPYQQRFQGLCSDLNIEMHDPLPDFLKYSQDDRRQFRFPNDVHPTSFGHQAIAESLLDPIKKMLK